MSKVVIGKRFTRLVLSLLVIALLTGCPNQPSKEELEQIKTNMLNYLEEKYDKEFVVDKIEYTWNTSDYQLSLHLKNNSDVTFFAYINKETGMTGDSFLLVYWNDEAQREFMEVFNVFFPEKPQLIGGPDIGVNFSPPSFREEVVKLGYPTLEEIMKTYPEKLNLGLGAKIVMKDPSVTPDEYQKRIFGFLERYSKAWIKPDFAEFLFYESADNDIAKYTLDLLTLSNSSGKELEKDIRMHWHENY